MTTIIKPGDIFANLIAISYAGKNKHGNATWTFQCQCGNVITVPSYPVKTGRHKSCGCMTERKRQGGKFVSQPDAGDTKTCSTCEEVKEITSFRLDTRSPIPGKRHARCLACEHKLMVSRVQSTPILRLRKAISSLVRYSLQDGKGGESTWKHLPYTKEELKKHLEDMFDSWMTWDNYGVYRCATWNDNDPATWVWQIDHIIPVNSFSYTSMNCQEFRDCWSLSNLRPLSAKENVKKGTKPLPL